jgi:NADH-quinone oxidoreductase E subunit
VKQINNLIDYPEMETILSPENIKKLDDIIKRYPKKQAAILHALWMIQEQYGWISTESMKYIGDYLDIPYEQVYGVSQFYTMFNKKPIGKNHIQVCTNVSCMLRGGYDILNFISERLGIKPGDTTDDNKFTLSEVECLGSCGTAPMMQVNNFFEENLTKEKLEKILAELSK